MNKKVVITGMGAITPIGNNIKEYWYSLINGISGSTPISYFNTEYFKTKFACQIKNYDPDNFFSIKEKKKLNPCAQYGLIACEEAIFDSGLILKKEKKDRIGVVWGSGLGGISNFENEVFNYVINKTRLNTFFIPKILIDTIGGLISIKYGILGPNYSTVSSCASSANAIIDAYYLICLDKADIIITGGSEAAITQTVIGGFNALNALSTKNFNYKTASRPFERDRDGFVLGEGSGCIILEEYNHAVSRGTKIYAEIGGVGMSSDAYHITSPDPNGLGIIQAMNLAIKSAKISKSKIDYINTHGTSTIRGDITEIKAIKKVFGEKIYNLNISSTKSMTGHLLGASGVIESIASILTMNYNIIPPTINHNNSDYRIDIKVNLTLNKAQKKNVLISISNTFGFGGHNISILYKKIYENL